MVTINAKSSIVLPHPSMLFPESELKNYEFVAITMDDKSKQFPYQYPQTISSSISASDYKQLICKVNGIIFPERHCYDLSDILSLYFIPILSILFCFFTFALVSLMNIPEAIKDVYFYTCILVFIIMGVRIVKDEESFKSPITAMANLQDYLLALEDRLK